MKKALSIVLIFSLYSINFCQSQTPSTIGQIYNLSVGDTFEYEWDSYSPGCAFGGYVMCAITSKTNITDTITYLYAEYATPVHYYNQCEEVTYGPGIGADPLIVTNNDSSIFTLLPLPCGNSFSSDCYDSVVTDSLYNGRKQDIVYFFVIDEIDNVFVDGLGPAYSYSYDETDGSFTDMLVYYHKANGETWGTPLIDTLFTDVKDLRDNLTTLKVFPNPATNMMTIDYSFTNWGASTVSLVIVNELGQFVYNQPVGQNSSYQSIDVSKYAAGIYSAYMKQNEQVIAVQRFAKE